MGGFVEDELAVDDHVFNAVAVVEWVFVSGAVDDTLLVENRDVGEHAGLKQTAVAEADFRSTERSHFADGVFEPEQTALARINAKHSREGPEVAWMRIAAAQRAVGRERGAIRADGAPGLAQREVHVLLR